jgi:hypothetical protein
MASFGIFSPKGRKLDTGAVDYYASDSFGKRRA